MSRGVQKRGRCLGHLELPTAADFEAGRPEARTCVHLYGMLYQRNGWESVEGTA
ncbi:hypothetical protein [Natrinema pallidum]|uniref:hypothetical protein n=1 Tax=Natrinema pallidum TaxID=69527 RepID=UPI0013760F6A|nr:hypothetical protein [Natrinema pallidum]